MVSRPEKASFTGRGGGGQTPLPISSQTPTLLLVWKVYSNSKQPNFLAKYNHRSNFRPSQHKTLGPILDPPNQLGWRYLIQLTRDNKSTRILPAIFSGFLQSSFSDQSFSLVPCARFHTAGEARPPFERRHHVQGGRREPGRSRDLRCGLVPTWCRVGAGTGEDPSRPPFVGDSSASHWRT